MKLKINNAEYEVIQKEIDINEETNHVHYGDCDYPSCTITYPPHTYQRSYRALIHEIAHAYVNEYLLSQRKFTSEQVANFIEKYAVEIIRDANVIFNEVKK